MRIETGDNQTYFNNQYYGLLNWCLLFNYLKNNLYDYISLFLTDFTGGGVKWVEL